MNPASTALHQHAFSLLQVTARDAGGTIVAAADDRALLVDPEACQKARAELTNPRTRLRAEVAWLPGVAPRTARQLVADLHADPACVRNRGGLPALARANLIAALIEGASPAAASDELAAMLLDLANASEVIDVEEVRRDINEDRAVAGFPEVRSLEAVEGELRVQRGYYLEAMRGLLNRLPTDKLIAVTSAAIAQGTTDGERQGPALLDDLIDRYEVEAQGFLQKEEENIHKLIDLVRESLQRLTGNRDPRSQDKERAVQMGLLQRLEEVARNWCQVARPIQISARSRGVDHRQSSGAAMAIRGLAVFLNNEHGMLEQANQLTDLLREIFDLLPEVAEKLETDSAALEGLRRDAANKAGKDAEWERAVTFRADVGLVLRAELAISPDGIVWKGRHMPLESVSRVRWGAVRRSVNGVPTGTDYTIAFGDQGSEQVVRLKRKATYEGFVNALWRAVCGRLVIQTLQALAEGRSFTYGAFTIDDTGVTFVRRRLLGPNETIRLGWNDAHVWSLNGNFVIASREDRKVYATASYIHDPNTHIIEHIIRNAFNKGCARRCNSEPPCRPNSEPGMGAGLMMSGGG